MGRWFWMPTTAVVLGMLSLAMLAWIDRIGDRQRSHFAFANALMDLRVGVATSHLWLEEAITGKASKEMNRAWSDLGEVVRLSEVILHGGESEHGLIVQPLVAPELRKRAEDVAHYATQWAAICYERIQNPAVAGEGSALENRSDAIFDAFQQVAAALEESVEQRQESDYRHSRNLILAILAAWSLVVAASIIRFVRWQWGQRRRHAELRTAKDELEKQVSERTADLRRLNEQLRVELGERSKAEAAVRESESRLRDLSKRLMVAQETERTRISKELHDQLGHSLVLAKLRLGLIRKELKGDQTIGKDACDDLSGFIDEVIDDVRKLSRDLRPSVLDDLGLSGALRWLMHGLKRDEEAIAVAGLCLEDLDRMFPPEAQVVLFRIVQEALTNAQKHADAARVSLRVGREGDGVCFVVEDDGKGFDVNAPLMKEPGERGMGLAAMHERARMLNGSFAMWSEKGNGTRMTLCVPASTESPA